VVPSWLMCVVLLGYFSYKVYIDLNIRGTLGWVMLVRCSHSVEVSFHYVHMRFMVMFNMLVVKIDYY
jgi:hypothetical protein